MRNLFAFALLLTLLTIPALAEEPFVDQKVSELAQTHGEWLSGFSPELKAKANASVPDIVAEAFGCMSFDNGRVTSHKVLETRQVSIPESGDAPFTAVVVETNLGKKLLIMHYRPKAVAPIAKGWWIRFYDIEAE